MADNFTINEIKAIRECFDLYARKRYIEKEAQLRFIMRSLGHVPTVKETRDYMKEFGPKIFFANFLEILACERQRPVDPVYEVAKAFHNLDDRKTGNINRTELFRLLTAGIGEKMDPVEVEIALQRMGLAGNKLRIEISQILNHISSC
ncbi:hypothetical protein M3Y95_01082000 [Aphelenchoides besseyi]|nr:hypothetical protein M3Y95_01082000 [Aphelenchoides besseyi]